MKKKHKQHLTQSFTQRLKSFKKMDVFLPIEKTKIGKIIATTKSLKAGGICHNGNQPVFAAHCPASMDSLRHSLVFFASYYLYYESKINIRKNQLRGQNKEK